MSFENKKSCQFFENYFDNFSISIDKFEDWFFASYAALALYYWNCFCKIVY